MSCHVTSTVQAREHCTKLLEIVMSKVWSRECREDDVNPKDVCIHTKQLEVVQNKRRCRSAYRNNVCMTIIMMA